MKPLRRRVPLEISMVFGASGIEDWPIVTLESSKAKMQKHFFSLMEARGWVNNRIAARN
jgi:hypothetical protein